MNKGIVKYQQMALRALSGRIDGFYLAGGTALSLYYFQHRLSVDLDFFTRTFVYTEITKTTDYLAKTLKKKVENVGLNLEDKTAKIAVYNIYFTAANVLKIDFVEDTVELIGSMKNVDGINVLSLDDIYLRKLYAMAGMAKIVDEAGRERFIGGRSSAKDYYDVYYLSHTFMPMSKFVTKYCGRTMLEAVVRWFRTYDRMEMMDDVLTLATNKSTDFRAMEQHFKKEIDKILDYQLDKL
jgi:predicted nucleotidyltransferase component of viral defense system